MSKLEIFDIKLINLLIIALIIFREKNDFVSSFFLYCKSILPLLAY